MFSIKIDLFGIIKAIPQANSFNKFDILLSLFELHELFRSNFFKSILLSLTLKHLVNSFIINEKLIK